MCPVQLWAAPRAKLRSFGSVGRSDGDGARVRVFAFTTPRHGWGCRSCSCGRSFRRRASTRTGSRTGLGFWIRWSVSSAAGHPCAKADSTAAWRLRASRVPSVHASVTASKMRAAASLGSDGDSIDGFKGSRCGTPGGSHSDTVPVPQWDGGRFAAGPSGGPGSGRGVPDRDGGVPDRDGAKDVVPRGDSGSSESSVAPRSRGTVDGD